MAISTRTILSQPRSDWRVERRGDVVCAFRCTTPGHEVSKSSLFVTRIHVIRVRRAGYPWKRSIRVHAANQNSATQTMEWITCSSALSTAQGNDVGTKRKKELGQKLARLISQTPARPPRRRSLQRRREIRTSSYAGTIGAANSMMYATTSAGRSPRVVAGSPPASSPPESSSSSGPAGPSSTDLPRPKPSPRNRFASRASSSPLGTRRSGPATAVRSASRVARARARAPCRRA